MGHANHGHVFVSIATNPRSHVTCFGHWTTCDHLQDFMQMLSVFAGFGFEWPPAIKALFHALSAVNFNLDLVAPDCGVSLKFETKWWVSGGLGPYLARSQAFSCLYMHFAALALQVAQPSAQPSLTLARPQVCHANATHPPCGSCRGRVRMCGGSPVCTATVSARGCVRFRWDGWPALHQPSTRRTIDDLPRWVLDVESIAEVASVCWCR
jgi:hypothetical protein